MILALIIQVVGMFAYIILADIQHIIDQTEERFDLRKNILLSVLWWAFLVKALASIVGEKLLEYAGDEE